MIEFKRGVFLIRNVSGETLSIEEIGLNEFSNQESIDLMDSDLPTFYSKHSDVVWAANSDTTQLGRDIAAGKIEVVTSYPERWGR
jgi:hypothetical protein